VNPREGAQSTEPASSERAFVTARFDAPWKAGLQRFFRAFLAFCFPNVHAIIDWEVAPKFLDKELQPLAPTHAQGQCVVDVLVEVKWLEGDAGWLMVHVELQAQPDRDFPLRMWVYHYRIWDRYQRPLVSLAVLADADPKWRPSRYRTEIAGCVQAFEFPIFKVLDCEDPAGAFERTGNPFALLVAAHQVALRTKQDLAARVEERFGVVKYLYRRGLAREEVVELFRLIAWLTFLPRDFELQFQEKLATFEHTESVMTADTLLAPIEIIALERGREEGSLIGRIQYSQDLLKLERSKTEELAQRPTAELERQLSDLEARLRDRLRL
jgi:hypothetical protein